MRTLQNDESTKMKTSLKLKTIGKYILERASGGIIMISIIVFEEDVEEIPRSHNPQWSTTVWMVAKEMKKMDLKL